MKRSISDRDQYENLTMANCLMFLSGGRSTATASVSSDHHHHFEYTSPPSSSTSSSPSRVFECKTCNRQFPSFQALGGHRASHKKPRLAGGPDGAGGGSDVSGGSPAKPKTHECNVCGLEFAIGQALGGHMRRHRAAMAENNNINNTHQVLHQYHHQYPFLVSNINNNINNLQAPVVKKISSSNNNSRRVLCLDLNLTPLENDIKILQLGKPLVGVLSQIRASECSSCRRAWHNPNKRLSDGAWCHHRAKVGLHRPCFSTKSVPK